jgi:hypothetical protein
VSEYMPPPQYVVDEWKKECDCCPECNQCPCDGVMAGGLCDNMPCNCDDYEEPEEVNCERD